MANNFVRYEDLMTIEEYDEETQFTNNIEDNQNDKINNHTEENNYNDKDTDTFQKDRKSVIEENFGADINNDDLEYYDDKPRRKKGKHF